MRTAALTAVLAALAVTAGLAGFTLLHPSRVLSLLPDRPALAAQRAVSRAVWRMGGTLAGTPDLAAFEQRLAEAGVGLGAPVAIRIFKRSFELELWVLRGERFHLFASYPICAWSGRLGPKLAEGDRQSPEGFYSVDAGALNPDSRWHRSFNLGFPNAFDRGHGRTGSYLMVHGGCGSIGCYAVTNKVIDEIWALVTAALDAGQRRIPVMVLPFRMRPGVLEVYRDDPRADFWAQLAAGDRIFEATGRPPVVSVCGGRYVVSPAKTASQWQTPIAVRCAAGG